MGIWGRFNRVEKFHGADVVQIYLVLQNHDQSLPVQPDRKYRRRKCELAYGGLSLRTTVSLWTSSILRMSHLGICDLKPPRRENEGNERRGEQHLEDGNVAIPRLGAFREWIGGVNSEAFRGSYDCVSHTHGARYGKPTNSQMAIILIECDKVHRHCSRGLSQGS